jgi:hypothetical protein
MNTRDHVLELCSNGDVEALRRHSVELVAIDTHAKVIAEWREEMMLPDTFVIGTAKNPECVAVSLCEPNKSVDVLKCIRDTEGYGAFDEMYMTSLAAMMRNLPALDWMLSEDFEFEHWRNLDDAMELDLADVVEWYAKRLPHEIQIHLGEDSFDYLERFHGVDFSDVDTYMLGEYYASDRRGREAARKISQIIFDAKEFIPNAVYLDVMNCLRTLYAS